MRQTKTTILIVLTLSLILVPLAEAQLSSEYATWDDGPEKFLLTKKEKKEWSKIKTDEQAEQFVELFWARRNQNPKTPFNTFKAEFDARVAYADENFAGKNLRGALSDRGRVLILMGAPRRVQVSNSEPPNNSTGSQVVGSMSRWLYDPANLPSDFEIKGGELIFDFHERQFESNDFALDRDARHSSIALRALGNAAEVYLLHPELMQVPTPVSINGAASASEAHLAWLGESDAPFNDEMYVISELGVGNAVSRPFWVHLELPAEAPKLDLLVGRVIDSEGEMESNFEIAAKVVAGQYGSAYHLAFALEEGSHTIELAGASGENVQLTQKIEAEIETVPIEGTWMSPMWVGLAATPEKEAPLGAPFTFGGWHMVPMSGPAVTRDNEITYFGYIVRPVRDEEGAIDLRARIRVRKDGKSLGRPFTMPLETSQIIGELYMYGNSVPLSGLPEPGDYSLEFKISERGADVDVERAVDITITDENPFVYGNVSVRQAEGQKIVALGEVTNNTEETFATTSFHIALYDGAGGVVVEKDFSVENLGAGQTVPFEVEFDQEFTEIKNFLIQHESQR